MTEFRCLNKHSHPEPTRGCGEGCMMCCGYTTPAMTGLLIASLGIVSDVYSIILIARNPHSAWRVVVCLIVFVLTTALGVVVCWSFWEIIFTPPGFVPHETWRYPPIYAGQSAPPRDQCRTQGNIPAGNGGGQLTPQSQPPLQLGVPAPPQQSQQQLAASLVRRSPNLSGDAIHPVNYPSPLPPAPVSTPSQQPQQIIVAVNPLQGHDDVDTRRSFTDSNSATATVVTAKVLCNGSANSGNGNRERSQQSHDETVKPAEEKPISGSSSNPVDVPAADHCPYATPHQSFNCASGTTSTAAAPPVSSSAPSPNPYHVLQLSPNGYLRYCSTCRQYKPDGAHHCRICKKCVFNFDHHCPFVNNCVGRNNYKLFIIFLLYSGVGSTLAGGLMVVTLFAVDRDDIMSKVGWVLVPGIDIVLGLALILFYIQHRVLLCRGESTLDSIIRDDSTFRAWRQSFGRPKSTAAEKEELRRQKEAKVAQHYRTMLGNESPWWRRYLPIPVRTDDRADDTVAGNA